MALNYEENLDSFAVTFRREIVFYLRQLINDSERVNVMFNEGRDTLLTVLIDVNEENDTLIFDWGGSESANRRLLISPRTIFVANPQGVRNQFVTTRVWETSYRKRPAFATHIPAKYVRLQRREFFRLMLPMTRRCPCTFTSAETGKPWEMLAVDIGLGGVGLEAQTTSLPFETGQILPRVQIDLGKFGKLLVDLEIRYAGAVARGTKQFSRLGCHFVRLNHAQENEVQRFLTQVQREERAKLG